MTKQNNAAQVAVQAAALSGAAIDSTQCALLKVQALIAMTHGEAGEEFRNMNDAYQDRFLWAISDLIDEATNLVKEMAAQGVPA